jgi:hypothetical protein
MDYRKAVERLEEAIASNTLEVTIGDQTVKYRSLSELLKALAYFKTALGSEKSVAYDSTGPGYSQQAIAGRGIRGFRS